MSAFVPLGISAAVVAGLLLWAPRKSYAATPSNGTPSPGTTPARRWPTGTAVAVVSVDPSDPGLQGRAPGVRLRSQPTANSTLLNQGIPNGTRVAVLSGEIADAEGRMWRRIATLAGQEGYAPFVGPGGETNMRMDPSYPTPWPSQGESAERPLPIPIAGLPSPYAHVGACPDPRNARNPVGCPPGGDPAYGWAPWASAWSPAVRVDAVGQLPILPGGEAICVRPCELYRRFERGASGWTIGARLPAGARVRLAPSWLGLQGPGANYLTVIVNGQPGWIRRSDLQTAPPATLGRRGRTPAPVPTLGRRRRLPPPVLR